MNLSALAFWIGLGIAAVVAAVMVRRAVLRAIGAWRTRRAGPARLRASHHRIWRDPGAIETLDLVHGPGGADHAPAAPFTFLEEPATGSQPCLSVRDARGRRWRIKWGHRTRQVVSRARSSNGSRSLAGLWRLLNRRDRKERRDTKLQRVGRPAVPADSLAKRRRRDRRSVRAGL
jgi:hypothetical protein